MKTKLIVSVTSVVPKEIKADVPSGAQSVPTEVNSATPAAGPTETLLTIAKRSVECGSHSALVRSARRNY